MSTQRRDDHTVHVVREPEMPSLFTLIHFILAIFALYLTFLCNNGFSLGGFIFAICCPWIYVPWILATKATNCPYPMPWE